MVDYARFRAAADRLGTDWRRWPARERSGELGEREDRAARYHAFVQWLVHCQLVDVSRRCDARGQVLALDLPLGVHPDGYNAWRHRDQYLAGLEVGAPPDRFFPRGQAWSFPPPDLEAARRSGHALFRAALAHHLRVASMLRIDHVLGLQRLFCVPHGGLPKDGVYVECPLEELLAVVAIEAQRHHAAIVGEDLGTVDAGVRRAMARDGLRRYFAVELTVGRGGSSTFPAPPPGSVASFTTHDLATFEGWWEGRDVSELVELGQVDAAAGASMLATRHLERAALATLVAGGDGDEPPPGLLAAALERLARSDAGLVVAQLDDVLGEHEGVNLRGPQSSDATGRDAPRSRSTTSRTPAPWPPRSSRCTRCARRRPGPRRPSRGHPPRSSTASRGSATSTTTSSTRVGTRGCSSCSAPTR